MHLGKEGNDGIVSEQFVNDNPFPEGRVNAADKGRVNCLSVPLRGKLGIGVGLSLPLVLKINRRVAK